MIFINCTRLHKVASHLLAESGKFWKKAAAQKGSVVVAIRAAPKDLDLNIPVESGCVVIYTDLP